MAERYRFSERSTPHEYTSPSKNQKTSYLTEHLLKSVDSESRLRTKVVESVTSEQGSVNGSFDHTLKRRLKETLPRNQVSQLDSYAGGDIPSEKSEGMIQNIDFV